MDFNEYMKEYIGELSEHFPDKERAVELLGSISRLSSRRTKDWQIKLVERLGLVTEVANQKLRLGNIVIDDSLDKLETLRDEYMLGISYNLDSRKRLVYIIMNKENRKRGEDDWNSKIRDTGGGNWSLGQRYGGPKTRS
jgi:hypothetical protein